MSNTNQGKQENEGRQTKPLQHKVSERALADYLAPAEPNPESPREEDEHLHVVGTQGALAGVGDTVGAAHGVVDHGAGQQLTAILQRGPGVVAAVQLGESRTAKALHGLYSVQGSPNTTPPLMPLPKSAYARP